MPAYKDEKRKSWYCSFYYTDFQGNQKRKVKRGFAKKEEAKEWERNFLVQQQQTSDISFATLCEHYMKDCRARLKLSTCYNRESYIRTHLLPYFAQMAVADITPLTVRNWQNEAISKGYKPSYLRAQHQLLSSILNYAVSYFGLKENPCKKTGPMGKKRADAMDFWTVEEFNAFINVLKLPKKLNIYTMVTVLFWTGMRIGELLALTLEDINTDNNTISITKTYAHYHGKDVIQSPKTESSKRVIDVPKELIDLIVDFADKCDIKPNQRIFEHHNAYLAPELKRICKKNNLKCIRVHDLRHSHASFLINNGFSPVVIKDRLGHENIETTLQTYSHLYPSTKEAVVSAISSAIVSK